MKERRRKADIACIFPRNVQQSRYTTFFKPMVFIQSEPQARFGLSTQDLFDISQAISREFSPYIAKSDELFVPSIPYSPQELLSISQEISREFAPRAAENHTNLVLLPIDTRRLHAYWHINENKSNILLMPIAKQALTLRIFKQEETNTPLEKSQVNEQPQWFDIAIEGGKCQQEVILPDNMLPGASFRAAIGAPGEAHAFTAIAGSNLVYKPNRLAQMADTGYTGLSTVVTQFIMPNTNQSSPTGKPLS